MTLKELKEQIELFEEHLKNDLDWTKEEINDFTVKVCIEGNEVGYCADIINIEQEYPQILYLTGFNANVDWPDGSWGFLFRRFPSGDKNMWLKIIPSGDYCFFHFPSGTYTYVYILGLKQKKRINKKRKIFYIFDKIVVDKVFSYDIIVDVSCERLTKINWKIFKNRYWQLKYTMI